MFVLLKSILLTLVGCVYSRRVTYGRNNKWFRPQLVFGLYHNTPSQCHVGSMNIYCNLAKM
jgi:hypothetical protein